MELTRAAHLDLSYGKLLSSAALPGIWVRSRLTRAFQAHELSLQTVAVFRYTYSGGIACARGPAADTLAVMRTVSACTGKVRTPYQASLPSLVLMLMTEADEAYVIGKRGQYTPVGAYLAGDEIIKIALQHGVQMIHPGMYPLPHTTRHHS